jgi:hypothetical protein
MFVLAAVECWCDAGARAHAAVLTRARRPPPQDTASNWGNWVSAAGLTGGRINHFNITKQSKDYDAEGEYIRWGRLALNG